MANSPEEHNTRVTFKWLPEQDNIWHKTTPFVLQLEKLTWERWLIEAEYMSNSLKDTKRAYLATKEAFRVEPNNPTVSISHGWFAFKAGRLEEAIQVTKRCEKTADNDSKSISFINIGMYYLSYCLSDRDNKEKHHTQAQEWYRKAIESLEVLSPDSFQFVAQSAINDILEHRDILDNIADAYLRIFQSLSTENTPIGQAKTMCEDIQYIV